MHRVILDTDIGGDIDDAFTLVMCKGSPEVDLRGVSTVYGDTQRRALLAARMLRTMGDDSTPVAVGIETPAVEAFVPDPVEAQFLAIVGDRPSRPFVEVSALELLKTQCAEHAGEIVIVAIGPLTNLGRLFEAYPQVCSQIRELVIMGGAFEQDEAEWNIKNDPDAAKVVLESDVPMRIVPFDRTRHAVMPTAQLERLYRESRPAQYLLARLTHLWQGGYGFGCNPCLHDPLAMGCLTHPELYTFEPMAIEVLVEPGARRGATIGRHDPSSRAQVCTAVDYEGFFTAFEERIFTQFPASIGA